MAEPPRPDVRKYNLTVVTLLLALGGVLMGIDTSSIAVFMSLNEFKDYFDNPSSFVQGIIAASNPAGAFFGCILAGTLAERIGSIFTIRIGTAYWIAGTLVSVCVVNVIMVAIGRALKGVAVGILAAHIPVYVSEVIPSHKKEFLMAVIQWCLTWGILLMFLLGYVCIRLGGTLSFRVAWGIEALPALILLLFCGWLPESPKWLISKKRWSEGLNILQNFKDVRQKKQENAQRPEEQKQEPVAGDIEKAIDAYYASFKNGGKKCTFRELFSGKLLKHTMTGLFMQTIIQMTSINVLMYFLVFICEMIGLRGNSKILATSFQYVINVLFTIFPILWLGCLRRKDVIVFATVTLGACLISISVVMGYFGHSVPPMFGNPAVQWEIKGKPGSAVLALCYLFVAIFASTIACAGWVYTEEIFPRRAKSKGSAVCISTSWVVSTALTFVGPVLLQYLKWATFMVFGFICLLNSVVIMLAFPETYQKTDEEIENLFVQNGNAALHFGEKSSDGKFVIADDEENATNSNADYSQDHHRTVSSSPLTVARRVREQEKFVGDNRSLTEGSSAYNTPLNHGFPRQSSSRSGSHRAGGGSDSVQISPFHQEPETSSIFGRPINLVDSFSNRTGDNRSGSSHRDSPRQPSFDF